MSEKQYKVVKDNLDEYSVLRYDNSIVCTELKYKATAELFCDELNELSDTVGQLQKENEKLKKENNHLKYKLGDRDEAFEVFACTTWDKTINLIDKHINYYNESLKKYSKNEKLYDILMHKRGALKYFKECFEVMIGRKHYCTDCEHLQYDKDYEDMDCGNVHALPENGAPEIISSEVHTCPYWTPKREDL